jgi:hypothetical protein
MTIEILKFSNESDAVDILLVHCESKKFVVTINCDSPEIGIGSSVFEFATYEEAVSKFFELCKNESEAVEIY